ncbi:MAG: hypothetical protein HND48_03620 [Chloroflexi bacterium]|nr:hypothetical protein [Chloroflexota bacterium]
MTATVAPTNDVTITWTTDELVELHRAVRHQSERVDHSQSDPLNTTSHSVTLFGLPLNTTFYYRVVSTDLSANTSTFPCRRPRR